MLAGCGTTHAAGTGPAAPAATKAATPRQRASTDAASIVSKFVPPKGAARLTSAPGGALSKPMTVPSGQNLVDKTAYWRVSGSPRTVLAWEKAHLPRQFKWAGQGRSLGSAAPKSEENFTLPAVRGVLPTRTLEVTAASAGGGQTAIRVDAQVTWVQARPLSERIPAAAKVVTLSAASGMVAGARHPSPVTITNAATVKRLESLVNGLPLFPPGIRSCPAGLGQAVQMTFAAVKNGPPLAVVKASTGGCDGVSVTVNGKQQPSLDGTAGVAGKALSIAGVHWPGYGDGAGGTHLPSGVNPGGPMRHGGG